MSPALWSTLGDLRRWLSHTLSLVFAASAGAVLKLLPTPHIIALRSKLTVRRYLDYDPAPIEVLVTSRVEYEVRLHSCEKEPETVAWLHRTLTPHSVLYDIGANIGAYSLVAASWTNGQATIYAFEPSHGTFSNLVENILINRYSRTIVPFQIALGAHTALADFGYSSADPGSARHPGIRHSTKQQPVVQHPVITFKLDDFVRAFRLQLPSHMKIDVDGGELGVLQGANDVLRSPALRWVLVEVDAADTDPAAIRVLLEQHGFRVESECRHAAGSVCNWIFDRASAS